MQKVGVVERVEFQNPVRAVGASKLNFKLKHFHITVPQTSLVRYLGHTTVCLAPYDQPFLSKVKIFNKFGYIKKKKITRPCLLSTVFGCKFNKCRGRVRSR